MSQKSPSATKSFFASAFGAVFGVFLAIVFAFVIVPALLLAIFAGSRATGVEKIKDNSILHVKLRGQIVERHRPLDFEIFGERSIFTEDHTVGLFELNRAIEMAKTDKRISGIFLELRDFDAGWGMVSGLRRKLVEFSKSGKWIHVYADHMDEMGYYLASAAHEIHMEPVGELEFNGLEVTEAFLKGLFDKLELQPQIFRVGKFKAAIEPLTRSQMSEENRLQTQTLIDDLWSNVREAAVGTLKTAAKKTEPDPAVDAQFSKQVDDMAGKLEVTSAEDAKKLGLIHDTMFIDEVEEKLQNFTVGKDEEIRLVTPGRLLREEPKKSAKDKIAVIFAEGEINGGTGGRDDIGSQGLREDILDAKADDDVAAIVVRINSPGGDALASDVLWRELRTTDDEVPVVVSMGDMAASGGYYIASAGRYIFAEPTTITGSIGVFGILFNSEKFFKSKTGVSFDRVVTHPHSDIGSFARSIQPFEEKKIQGDVERVYKRFLDVVQDSRGYEKREDLEGIAEGRVWSGARAKELGLVDELGGLEQSIAKAAEFAQVSDYKVEVFPQEGDAFHQLLDKFAGDAMSRAFAREFGTSYEQVRSLAKKVSSLEWWKKGGVLARMPYDMTIR